MNPYEEEQSAKNRALLSKLRGLLQVLIEEADTGLSSGDEARMMIAHKRVKDGVANLRL